MHTTRTVISTILGWSGLLILLAWVVGRLLTDRFHWSQYLYWAPTPWAAAAAGGLAALAFLTGFRVKRGRWTRRGALAAAAAVAAYMALVEHRSLCSADPAAPALTVLSWNATRVEEDSLRNVIQRHAPDLAGIVNAPWGADFRDLAGKWASIIHSGPFLLASKEPVQRWGLADLGIEAEEGGLPYGGRAMFAQVGGADPLVVWIIDLPSDPRLARKAVTARAAASLAAWTGSVYVRDGIGWRTERAEPPGFPRPDVVMGDFNIPRGSASLAALTTGMADAFTQAGTAAPATWPRQRPWWALDQVFIRAPWRATGYRVIDPGEGDHRLVVMRLAR